MYQDTVTVFNKMPGSDGDVWYPHVLTGVTLHKNKGANQEKTGPENADSAKLHVKYERNVEKLMIGNLEYMPPKAWNVKADPDKTITFHDGIDFFLEGEYPEEPVSDEKYRNGFYDFMKSSKDNVFLITNVDGPFKLITHLEIGGK